MAVIMCRTKKRNVCLDCLQQNSKHKKPSYYWRVSNALIEFALRDRYRLLIGTKLNECHKMVHTLRALWTIFRIYNLKGSFADNMSPLHRSLPFTGFVLFSINIFFFSLLFSTRIEINCTFDRFIEIRDIQMA